MPWLTQIRELVSLLKTERISAACLQVGDLLLSTHFGGLFHIRNIDPQGHTLFIEGDDAGSCVLLQMSADVYRVSRSCLKDPPIVRSWMSLSEKLAATALLDDKVSAIKMCFGGLYGAHRALELQDLKQGHCRFCCLPHPPSPDERCPYLPPSGPLPEIRDEIRRAGERYRVQLETLTDAEALEMPIPVRRCFFVVVVGDLKCRIANAPKPKTRYERLNEESTGGV